MTAEPPRTRGIRYATTIRPRLAALAVDTVLRMPDSEAPCAAWFWKHARLLGIQIIHHDVYPDVVILRIK